MAQTHIQQHQISGSLVGDISDGVARGDLVKSGRTIIDDLNSLRTQVKGILGAEAWTDEQAITLQNLKAQLTGSLVANSGSFAGDMSVAGESTLASAKISDLTDTRVVFAGADGALVDDAALSFASNTLVVGAEFAAGNITMRDGVGNSRIELNAGNQSMAIKDQSGNYSSFLSANGIGIVGAGDVSGPAARMNTDGIDLRDPNNSNSATVQFLASTGAAYFGGPVDGSVAVKNASDVETIKLYGSDGSVRFDGAADLNSTLDVAGQVDLAASGVATNVRGTLNVAEEATFASAIVSDLTDTRVVFAGASGALVDDAAFTFASNKLTIGGPVDGSVSLKNSSNVETLFLDGFDGSARFDGPADLNMSLDVAGQVDLAAAGVATSVRGSLSVAELADFNGGITANEIKIDGDTAQRLYIVDADGSMKDEANMTFDGSTLAVTGAVSGSGNFQAGGTLAVAGNSDLNGQLDVAGAVDLAASGLATSVRGSLSVAELADFNGGITANELKIDGDTAQRLYIVDADGSMKDESKLTFDGSELAVTGAVSGSGNFSAGGTLAVAGNADLNGQLDVAGQVDLAALGVATSIRGNLNVAQVADFNGGITANELKIDGDVAQRLYIVGASGELKDESKLTFDGSTLAVDAAATFTGNVQVDGDLRVNGSMTYIDTVNVRVEDAFIYLATGSLGTTDSGVVLHGGAGADMDLAIAQKGGSGEFIFGKGNRAPDGEGALEGMELVPAKLASVKLGSAENALSGSMSISGNDIKLAASAAAIVFDDAYRSASTYSSDFKLAASAAEWTAFQTQYPGKSLLGALGAGGGVGVNFRKKVIMGNNANFSGNTLDISAAGIGALRSTGQADADYGLDVYLNGVLLALGASADYTVPSTTQISFNYALNSDDVLTIVAKNIA